MYIAAMRIANSFGCDSIGIQYQQGLKDMTPASDLAEGLFNNVDRPPVYHPVTGAELYPGQALPHFNEVDEGAGVDALVTNRVWTALGLDPSTTLHDIRWGRQYHGDGIDDFVWVFEISGAAPASHFIRRICRGGQRTPAADVLSTWAAARSRASANRARSSGAGYSSWMGAYTPTWAAARWSPCQKQRSASAGNPPPRSGR